MQRGRDNRPDNPRGARVKKTPLRGTASCGNLLIPYQGKQEDHVSVVDLLLGPLTRGVPVVLVVEDPRLPKRKRLSRVRLYLVPMKKQDQSIEIVAGLETYGCEVFDPHTVTRMSFIRMGLNTRLSTVMASELNKLFNKGDRHVI